MTAPSPIVVFANLEADLWGVVCGGDEPRAAVATLTGADVEMAPARLDEDDSGWIVSAPALALRLEPLDAPGATADAERHLGACRVDGAVTIDGSEREFEIGGICLTQAAAGTGSLRLFGGWFAGGAELGLLAARPAGATSQDKDSVSVVALGEEHPEVIDPRLSTTYDEHGIPLRVGVEMWLADTPDAEDHRFHHTAGAVTGSAVTGSAALASLRAQALTCTSRGQDGAGVYLVVT